MINEPLPDNFSFVAEVDQAIKMMTDFMPQVGAVRIAAIDNGFSEEQSFIMARDYWLRMITPQ